MGQYITQEPDETSVIFVEGNDFNFIKLDILTH